MLNVAFQMDPLHTLSAKGDTTLILALEAQVRGAKLFYYHPATLAMEAGKVTAQLHLFTLRDPTQAEDWYQLGAGAEQDLSQMDVIHMRQDPPFDMAYITATHLLEMLHPHTLVVNDPASVRNAPEKIFPFLFAGDMPETLITSHIPAIERFLAQHGDIVVKPLYGYGGKGVFRLRSEGDNIQALLEYLSDAEDAPLVAQRFLPEVRDGDKRIILVDGKVEGVLGRIPAEGEVRANMRVGGTTATGELSARQQEICEKVGAECKARGLLFVGLDLIGDYLTEINVTSPTGLRPIKEMYGLAPEARLWDAIEAKLR